MKVPEKYRVRSGAYGSPTSYGCNGLFKFAHKGVKFQCIVSDQEGWDHVSVSLPDSKRTPTWDEMCFVKSLFWDDEETVIQYHPRKSDYVNCHNHCLHLWKPQQSFPIPPKEFV